jgi:hypothetical protein
VRELKGSAPGGFFALRQIVDKTFRELLDPDRPGEIDLLEGTFMITRELIEEARRCGPATRFSFVCDDELDQPDVFRPVLEGF